MCGIFGYYAFSVPLSRRQLLDILFSGLRRLEYRGYDSAGISIEARADHLSSTPPRPIIFKAKGNIPALEALAETQIDSEGIDVSTVSDDHVAISHTRWATHGEPSERNCHPVTSGPSAEFTVVHNGIITNFSKLRSFLEGEGHEFQTDTDTEVIPKLCALIHANLESPITFSELVMQVLRHLEGAYAVLVQSVHYPGELICCRRGSPVVFAVRNSAGAQLQRFRNSGELTGDCFAGEPLECFIASDDKAIIEHAREAIALHDGDVLHIKRGGWGIFNIDSEDRGAAVPRVMQKLEGQLESILRGDYEHFMLKEICEQPESLAATMAGRVKRVLATGDPYRHARITLGGIEPFVHSIRTSRRIVCLACGTSYHACLAMRPLLEQFSGAPVTTELASDFMDRRPPVFRGDAAIFLSQSGETADTLAALRYARANGALCIGVTNGVGSSLSRETECGVHLNAGYEMGVASTKAYTSQLVVLAMLALLLARDSIEKRALRDEIADALLDLPARVRAALSLDARMRQLAETLKNERSMFVLGRGHEYATAIEAALKIKEIALIHGEGALAGELKHGPLALIDAALPVIVIATRGSMHSKMLSVIQQLKARNARLIVICNEGDSDVPALLQLDTEPPQSRTNGISAHHSAAASPVATNGIVADRVDGAATGAAVHDEVLFVPQTVESLQPVVNVVPLQLLAYHLTVLRGLNVDQPRNLAKSVTVTED